MGLIKASKIENVLLVVAVALSALLLFAVIYTIGFLSHNLRSALAPSVQSGTTVNFNIQGAQNLGF
ncbi:MAG: hypothetical protein M1153_01425 [Patescibacteria group bacterium]|nr:hypothetical protein [Patescibacteria group bacterium]